MSRPIIVFYDPRFPLSDGMTVREEALAAVGAAHGADTLAEALRASPGGCFVNLHAPYFPKEAWGEIGAFLRRGGGLISVGGAPFRRPVARGHDGGWFAEAEQTAYHRELRIHETLPVDGARAARYAASEDIPLLQGKEDWFTPGDTWNLVPHVTKQADLPHQMGSAGPMDAHIYALLKGVTSEGREMSAPVVLWEHTKGDYAGGRWLFVHRPLDAAFWTRGGAAALGEWAAFCARGATELWLFPNYASYEPGERPMLTLRMQALGRGEAIVVADAAAGWARLPDAADPRVKRAADAAGAAPIFGATAKSPPTAQRSAHTPSPPPTQTSAEMHHQTSARMWTFRLSVTREGAQVPLWTRELTEEVGAEQRIVRLPVPIEVERGFYSVECVATAEDGEMRVLRQGFWGFDAALLAEGTPVSAGRDYFEKDGRPLPVVGMTYMTSDVARKFLFLPNASVWDRDMAHMRKAGINWIRTGIWTAYRNVMQVDGHASEEVLRAIDAFFLTAKKHGLQVTFTFFSFTPEPWEGSNPYLDPRSVEAQKRFVRSIVSRHRASTHVDWDLINEPSMFDPARIFSNGPRSSRDTYEREAFAAWLKARHGSIRALQERWNMTPGQLPDFAAIALPEPDDINFDVQDMHQGKNGARWLDYVLFSMEMHNSWARKLCRAIKEECPDHLVTVGQDEALGAQRPSPFFYAEAVDYTTVHSWWLNDHLVWDGIFAKTHDKPNVVQETGIMYVETPDGRAKRSETELRSLLERKYAYAFSTGGAGAIHWIWNTNFYMDNANESHIGALRADGTEKPEADVSYGFGRFMAETRDLFRDRRLEDVAVVFPYSNDFSNRKLAFDATTRLTRVLSYELKTPFRAVGEYHLEPLEQAPPKLIVLPSPHNFDDAAFDKLLSIVERTGATLLVTGPIGLDAYWRSTDRLTDVLGRTVTANVQREEMLKIGGSRYPVSFGNRRIAEASKGRVWRPAAMEAKADEGGGDACGQSAPPAADADVVIEAPYGAGRILWCPLPLELNERIEPMAALYRYALNASGCARELEWARGGELPGVYGRKLRFAAGALFVFVSEFASDASIEVKDPETGTSYSFILEKERSVLFAVDESGRVRSVYRPEEVEIRTEPALA